MSDRHENLNIKINLNHGEQTDAVNNFFDANGKSKPVTNPGDTIKLSYYFTADYYGRIVETFEALTEILTSGEGVLEAVLQVQGGDGLCIFAELMIAYTRLTDALKVRTQTV